MKRLLMMFLGMVIMCSTAMADNDKPIAVGQMPKPAQEFVVKYFPDNKVMMAKQEGNIVDRSYEVMFANGSKVEFDKSGEWTSVECKGTSVPDGIVPAPIAEYVQKNFEGIKVTKIEKEAKRYEIELSNKVELTFNKSFKLLELDF